MNEEAFTRYLRAAEDLTPETSATFQTADSAGTGVLTCDAFVEAQMVSTDPDDLLVC